MIFTDTKPLILPSCFTSIITSLFYFLVSYKAS